MVWAAADLHLQLTAPELQQLLGRFIAVLPKAAIQAVSNTLWAVATMGHQVPPQQLRQLMEGFVAVLPEADPQAISNTLWAVATMGTRCNHSSCSSCWGGLKQCCQMPHHRRCPTPCGLWH